MAKFSGFRQLKTPEAQVNALEYLQRALSQSLREIQTGLQNLTFGDNFRSFEVSVVIPAGNTDFRIQNRIGVTPSKRIIVRSNSNQVVDGTSPWDAEYVYLGNPGGTDATVTVVFLR